MSLSLSNNGGTYTLAPAGTHRAVCIWVVDLGTQETTWQGKVKLAHKVSLTFELVDELMDDGRPFVLTSTFTGSLHEKATLRKFLDNWRGRAFTDDELEGWDLKKVLGAPALVSVAHVSTTDRTYANITSANKLPKGMQAPDKPANPLIAFDCDMRQIPAGLPEWIKAKLRSSEEFQAGDIYEDQPPPKTGDAELTDTDRLAIGSAADDIPF